MVKTKVAKGLSPKVWELSTLYLRWKLFNPPKTKCHDPVMRNGQIISSKENSKTEAQPVILSQSCGKDNKYLFLFGIIS